MTFPLQAQYMAAVDLHKISNAINIMLISEHMVIISKSIGW
jgi:hypothetical protein